jgi:hypothetical protein
MFLKHTAFAAFVTVSLLVSNRQTTLAQSDEPKIDVGIHFTTLRLTEFNTSDPGVGGRIGFNLNKRIALEGEIDFLLRDLILSDKLTQGLFGVKAGWRARKLGVFGKARPGFVHFNETLIVCPAIFPPPLSCTVGGTTPFAFDLGGVLEIYPSHRTVLRFDGGDTMIRFERFRLISSGWAREHFVSHNPQFSVGASYRF